MSWGFEHTLLIPIQNTIVFCLNFSGDKSTFLMYCLSIIFVMKGWWKCDRLPGLPAHVMSRKIYLGCLQRARMNRNMPASCMRWHTLQHFKSFLLFVPSFEIWFLLKCSITTIFICKGSFAIEESKSEIIFSKKICIYFSRDSKGFVWRKRSPKFRCFVYFTPDRFSRLFMRWNIQGCLR